MFTFQATGYIVADPKAVVPLSGGTPFYSFKLSVKKRATKNKEACRYYISCVMDKSKKKLAEMMKGGNQAFVSGVVYDVTTYFSEKKQEEMVETKASVHHVELITFPAKKTEEEVEEKTEIGEGGDVWTV